jgi:ketose-bisphosphate aldolase
MEILDAKKTVALARGAGVVIPAFNVAHIPILKAVVEAVVSEDSVAMLQVARVEWEKMQAGSIEAVAEEYEKYKNTKHTLLHLDHVPVIDEDEVRVDYVPLIERAIAAGYQSVMIDGSRLPLDGNIAATKEASDLAHAAGVPCEAELGAVMGHESGPMPPYEEIFASKQGFTDVDEAQRFAEESGADWLSVAAGNIHGAIAEATRNEKKPEARLDIEHVGELYAAAGVPLVLHGGSGIQKEYIRKAVKAGVAKINVGTEVRQTYEYALEQSGGDVESARHAVYTKVRELIKDFYGISGTRTLLYGG